ncbi:unnamed protein product [Rotaria magnacalcarata]|uniref:Generative cell specific-1/HAP2 domain-containing protein n=1 Tax=Rotaria magnacalcarata TaxID=392030 RepID=A0A816NYH9_9BILA|nr:unnamed protein product [Rotaria magnacalcarata]CAF2154808.1 unnamed protein product [Rotaria magnacalcarata]CAF4051731.1 unnamed protein product [Rotaria magnacalcarata]
MLYSENFESAEIIINQTTQTDSFQKNEVFIIERARSVKNRNRQEIKLIRPLLIRLYIESAEIYPLEYLKSINNKIFPVSLQHLQTENKCQRNAKSSTFCGYDSYDIHTAKPIKGYSCKHCHNKTCHTIRHCLRQDDYWYNVYDIDSRQLHFSVYLHIYELADNLTWTSLLKIDLHGFPTVNKSTDIGDIQISSLNSNEHSIANNLLNEYKYLLVRQPILTVNNKIQSDVHEFMTVNKSELNLDENDLCKKMVRTNNRSICSVECSKHQPFDFWLSDKANELNRKPLRYAFHPALDLPIHEYNNKFKFLIPYKNKFRLNITLKQRQSIGFQCLVSISEISVESFSEYTVQIAITINNTGLSLCSIRVSLIQTQRKNIYFEKQEDLSVYHISPMHEQLVFFTISLRRSQRKKTILSPNYIKTRIEDFLTNSTLAERKFLLKYAHHCVCISICHCQCFKNTLVPNLTQLQCVPMLEDDINRAGLSRVNNDRLLELLTVLENPLIEKTNEQSRYVRKWFLFIAVFALCLNVLLIFTLN